VGRRGYASDYNITSANGTLAITPRPLTITAGDKQRAYGADNSTAAYVNNTSLINVRPTDAVSGLVNGDTISSVTETIDPAAAVTTNAGTGGLWTKASAAQFGSGTDANYTITYVDGHFTIVPREVLVTAGSASRDYGAPNPVVTAYTVERGDHTTGRGLLAGDDISGVLLHYAPGIHASTPGGIYASAIHVDPSSVVYTGATNLSNYRFLYAPGTLRIGMRGFDMSTPEGRAVTTGGVVIMQNGAGSGNVPVRPDASRQNGAQPDAVMAAMPQDAGLTGWMNRVVTANGGASEAHSFIIEPDGTFGFDLGRTRGIDGMRRTEIPGNTSEAIPVLFTDGSTRDLDGIYSINYTPEKLAIKPASKKVDIPDPKEIRSTSEKALHFLYQTAGGDFEVTFGNGIVALYPRDHAALRIVTAKDRKAERAVLASGLLTAVEELGVTPVEIRAVYIFNVLDEESNVPDEESEE